MSEAKIRSLIFVLTSTQMCGIVKTAKKAYRRGANDGK